MRNNFLIDRRTCLKGIGAALALPLLETMGWADAGKGKPVKPPVRLGFMYMPHGVIMDQFWPANPESFLSAPPPALESLRPVLDQCLLMKGISGVPIAPFNGAPHALELSTWLTAMLPDANRRSQINIAISADQIAANYVGASHLVAVPGAGHDAADAQGKPGGAERGLLFALQLSLAHPGRPRRDQSAQRAQPALRKVRPDPDTARQGGPAGSADAGSGHRRRQRPSPETAPGRPAQTR